MNRSTGNTGLPEVFMETPSRGVNDGKANLISLQMQTFDLHGQLYWSSTCKTKKTKEGQISSSTRQHLQEWHHFPEYCTCKGAIFCELLATNRLPKSGFKHNLWHQKQICARKNRFSARLELNLMSVSLSQRSETHEQAFLNYTLIYFSVTLKFITESTNSCQLGTN